MSQRQRSKNSKNQRPATERAVEKPETNDAPDGDGSGPDASRFDAFRRLSEARARGEMVFLPRYLQGQDRRLHVRQTIREDHQTRIANQDDEAFAKFDKLHDDVFSFLRGTCLLFYRDMAGEDAWMPTVLTLGDVHPENFGVMPSVDNVPIFGPNDFDESFYAPFTWDLKRGATAFMIGAGSEGGKSRKKQRTIAERFVGGYVDAMTRFAKDSGESTQQMRQDNAPKLIRHLIEDSLEDRSKWLSRKYHDEYNWGFVADDEHVPITHRVPEFQEALQRLVDDKGIDIPARAGELKVKDVTKRLGQGTASLGLPRYYLKVEGPLKDGSDDILIEFKHARRSALDGLTPPSDYVMDGNAGRISHAQGVLLVGGDQFYGAVELDGIAFMSRERAPYRDDIDLDDLSGKEWKKYADICGRSLAQAHALSDEAGLIDHDIEPDIVDAIGSRELFVADMVAFAEEAADRVRADHQHFRADHELGAFVFVDRVFR